MNRKRKFTTLAKKISGMKIKQVTTSYAYFVKTTIRANPQSLSKKFLFWIFLFMNAFWYLIPQTNKRGIIYIPSFYFVSEYLSIRILIHEMYHLNFPGMEEEAVVAFTRGDMITWKSLKK